MPPENASSLNMNKIPYNSLMTIDFNSKRAVNLNEFSQLIVRIKQDIIDYHTDSNPRPNRSTLNDSSSKTISKITQIKRNSKIVERKRNSKIIEGKRNSKIIENRSESDDSLVKSIKRKYRNSFNPFKKETSSLPNLLDDSQNSLQNNSQKDFQKDFKEIKIQSIPSHKVDIDDLYSKFTYFFNYNSIQILNLTVVTINDILNHFYNTNNIPCLTTVKLNFLKHNLLNHLLKYSYIKINRNSNQTLQEKLNRNSFHLFLYLLNSFDGLKNSKNNFHFLQTIIDNNQFSHYLLAYTKSSIKKFIQDDSHPDDIPDINDDEFILANQKLLKILKIVSSVNLELHIIFFNSPKLLFYYLIPALSSFESETIILILNSISDLFKYILSISLDSDDTNFNFKLNNFKENFFENLESSKLLKKLLNYFNFSSKAEIPTKLLILLLSIIKSILLIFGSNLSLNQKFTLLIHNGFLTILYPLLISNNLQIKQLSIEILQIITLHNKNKIDSSLNQNKLTLTNITYFDLVDLIETHGFMLLISKSIMNFHDFSSIYHNFSNQNLKHYIRSLISLDILINILKNDDQKGTFLKKLDSKNIFIKLISSILGFFNEIVKGFLSFLKSSKYNLKTKERLIFLNLLSMETFLGFLSELLRISRSFQDVSKLFKDSKYLNDSLILLNNLKDFEKGDYFQKNQLKSSLQIYYYNIIEFIYKNLVFHLSFNDKNVTNTILTLFFNKNTIDFLNSFFLDLFNDLKAPDFEYNSGDDNESIESKINALEEIILFLNNILKIDIKTKENNNNEVLLSNHIIKTLNPIIKILSLKFLRKDLLPVNFKKRRMSLNYYKGVFEGRYNTILSYTASISSVNEDDYGDSNILQSNSLDGFIMNNVGDENRTSETVKNISIENNLDVFYICNKSLLLNINKLLLNCLKFCTELNSSMISNMLKFLMKEQIFNFENKQEFTEKQKTLSIELQTELFSFLFNFLLNENNQNSNFEIKEKIEFKNNHKRKICDCLISYLNNYYETNYESFDLKKIGCFKKNYIIQICLKITCNLSLDKEFADYFLKYFLIDISLKLIHKLIQLYNISVENEIEFDSILYDFLVLSLNLISNLMYNDNRLKNFIIINNAVFEPMFKTLKIEIETAQIESETKTKTKTETETETETETKLIENANEEDCFDNYFDDKRSIIKENDSLIAFIKFEKKVNNVDKEPIKEKKYTNIKLTKQILILIGNLICNNELEQVNSLFSKYELLSVLMGLKIEVFFEDIFRILGNLLVLERLNKNNEDELFSSIKILFEKRDLRLIFLNFKKIKNKNNIKNKKKFEDGFIFLIENIVKKCGKTKNNLIGGIFGNNKIFIEDEILNILEKNCDIDNFNQCKIYKTEGKTEEFIDLIENGRFEINDKLINIYCSLISNNNGSLLVKLKILNNISKIADDRKMVIKFLDTRIFHEILKLFNENSLNMTMIKLEINFEILNIFAKVIEITQDESLEIQKLIKEFIEKLLESNEDDKIFFKSFGETFNYYLNNINENYKIILGINLFLTRFIYYHKEHFPQIATNFEISFNYIRLLILLNGLKTPDNIGNSRPLRLDDTYKGELNLANTSFEILLILSQFLRVKNPELQRYIIKDNRLLEVLMELKLKNTHTETITTRLLEQITSINCF
ncbi:uncharacterized protein ASCRUDRAFT_68825 [Ascoidea rubescens DSM 1968]|uniref:Uncharacterized protein n=1 Tax=Ascoidea rubescens DSM 1968 TaxID=1344418 RepID=A0A1D2VN61_9ASCO|nr:hypothetical protein ASCRUDRAFT_68825 [Ascoidea rubescens DSM 1968]ODV63043.1 hypothetical protein ASCRUDRAFT_68825 [Ascoidea rubescens DSM 1968]